MLFAVVAAYANSFNNEFHFDDFHTITDNPAVRSLGNVPRFFTDTRTFSVLPANRTYRPLVSTSLALDYALGHGYVPFWFHLSTFLWFLVLIGLLYLLFEAVLDSTEPAGRTPSAQNATLALLAAAWFGLHPAMAETVNYVIQRGDVYCTLGCVAALVLFARSGRARATGLYLLPFVVALLSKPPAAVFPLLLFFYVFFFEATEETRKPSQRVTRSLIAALPSVAATIGGLWLQSAMTPKSFAPSILSPAAYRLTQPFVWLRYCLQLFLPIHLNVDSDLQPFNTVNGRAWLGLLFLLLLLAAIAWCSRRRRLYPIAYGLIWFVVTQLPTSLYALSEVENDHRMFFSFPGLILATLWAAWLLLRWLLAPEVRRQLRPALLACAVLTLSGYAWGVHVRNHVWLTEESLWQDDVHKSPQNGRGLMIYGLTQMNKGAYPEALDLYERALHFTPNYTTLEINLGVVNGVMGRPAEAEKHFVRAIALTPTDDQAYAFYGRWLLAQDRAQDAIAQARRAIALNPERATERDVLLDALRRVGDTAGLEEAARSTLAAIPAEPMAEAVLRQPTGAAAELNRSLAQYRGGQYRESIESARQALKIQPGMAEAYNNIGAAYGALGEWNEAVANETKALQLNPSLEIAKNNLATFAEKKQAGPGKPAASAGEWVNRSLTLNQQGRYTESVAAAKAALKLDHDSAEAWNNIAADYEALHRWDEAIAAAQKAITLRPDFQLAKNNLAWSTEQKRVAAR